MEETVIEVNNLSKLFPIASNNQSTSLLDKITGLFKEKNTDFNALKDISFSLKKGETLGIIGHNGSGKSTLLKIISQAMYPSKGSIRYKGKMAAILDIGSGFHPELTGRDNAVMYGIILGMSQHEIESQLDQIVEFSEIGNYIDEPVKFYSDGMYLRLAFAVAIFCDVDIMIFDEVLSVGDTSFVMKSQERIKEIKKKGTSIIVVSHNMDDILRMCDKCIWLDKGIMMKYGSAPEVVAAYLESHWRTNRHLGSGNLEEHNHYIYQWEEDKRPANQYIEILSIDIKGNSAEYIQGGISYNEDFTIQIRYRQKDLSQCSITPVIVVIDQYNATVIISTSVYSGNFSNTSVGNGIFISQCTFPAQMINAGLYKFNLSFFKDNKIAIFNLFDAAYFRIVIPDEELATVLKMSSISLSSALKWEINREDSLLSK